MNKHDKILESVAEDLKRDGYKVMKHVYYPSPKKTVGEMDILAFKDGRYSYWEIKSNIRGFYKGLEQLDRAGKYFPLKEKYLVMESQIYLMK